MTAFQKIHRCFPDKSDYEKLETTIDKDDLTKVIRATIQKIIDGPIQSISIPEKKKSQTAHLRTLENTLISNLPEKIETIGTLRSTVQKIRAAIRKATSPNSKYKNRGMANEIVAAVEQEQFSIEQDYHEQIQARFDRERLAAAERLERLQPAAVLSALLTRIAAKLSQLRLPQNKVLLAGNEKVTEDGCVMFLWFHYMLEEIIKNPSSRSTMNSAMKDKIDADTSFDEEMKAAFKEWTDLIVPETLECPTDEPTSTASLTIEPDGSFNTMPEYLLMPQKMAVYNERKGEANGKPDWNMTEEERLCARAYLKTEQGKYDSDWNPENDGAFLCGLARHVNIRCNGGNLLVRADREIRAFVTATPLTDTPPPSEDTTPPPTADAEPPVPPAETSTPDEAHSPEQKRIYTKRVPTVSETAPAHERCDAAIAATEALLTPISKGDQVARQLLLELHLHLTTRRETFRADPESKTSFDEFAIRFLLALTQRTSKPLLKPNRAAHSVNFEQDFAVHLEGATIILEDLRTLLPAHPAAASLDSAKKADYVRKTNDLLAVITPIAATTRGQQGVASNKYISQALLCSMQKDLVAVQTALRSGDALPAQISEAYLRTLFALCECMFVPYKVDPSSQELTSHVPNKDFIRPAKQFVQFLRAEFDKHDAHPRQTATVATPAPEPEEDTVTGEPATIDQPIPPPATPTEIPGQQHIDAAALSQAMAERKKALAAERADLQRAITTALQTTYRELTAFDLHLQVIETVVEDAILDAMCTSIRGEIAAIDALLPRGIHIDAAKDRSMIELEKLAAETERLVEASTAARTAAQPMLERYRALTAELKGIPAQEKAIRRVEKLQAKLAEALETLLPLLQQ